MRTLQTIVSSMSKPQHVRQNKIKQGRLAIVAELYKKGYTVRAIRAEVMKRLNLATYAVSTVQSDIQTLLDEWRKYRVRNMDDLLELELARIDDTCKELWEQWEESKRDYVKERETHKGAPSQDANSGQRQVKTFAVERSTENVHGLGNTSYIAEIRQQLIERRKLLGLYAPEKKDVQGSLSFASFLMESGMIDEAEKDIAANT